MMDLSATVQKFELVDEPERFDFLKGVQRRDITRIDEVHPSRDNDAHFIFLIWVPVKKHDKVQNKILKNISKQDDEWATRIMPNTGNGLIIVNTCIGGF